MGKEEKDVGRRTTLSPSGERPEQVIPNVTVQSSQDRSDDSTTPVDFEKSVLGMGDIAESPIEEKSFIMEETSFVKKMVV